VHLVQQGRHALHLVQHDDALRWQAAQLHGEQAGIGEERLITRLVQQVNNIGIGKLLPRPSALARAANAEQEKASLRRRQQAAVINGRSVVILPRKMTTDCEAPIRLRYALPAGPVLELNRAAGSSE
jgi:hypothetical protein